MVPERIHKVIIPNTSDDHPFPTNCLPKPLEDITRKIAVVKSCSEALVAVALLVACAVLIGGRTKLVLRTGWLVSVQIFAAIVGASGTGKTHVLNGVFKPIQNIQSEMLDEHEAEFEAWKKGGSTGPRPVAERLWTSNPTIELLVRLLAENPDGVGWICDELNAVYGTLNQYKKGNGTDEQTLLSTFSSAPILFERVTARTKEHSGIYRVDNPFLCIVGTIQPEILRERQREKGGHYENSGLDARFLKVLEKHQKLIWTPEGEEDETQELIAYICGQLLKTRPSKDGEPKLKTLTPEAKKVWIDFYERKGAVERFGYEAALQEKLTEYAAKFALISHLVRLHCSSEPGLTYQVDAQSMRNGIVMSDWFYAEALKIQGMFRYDTKEQAALRFLEMTPREGQPAHKVASSSRLFNGVVDAQNTLKGLIDKGRVCFVDLSRTPGISGRPADGTYRVIPQGVSCKPEETPETNEVSMTGGSK